MSTIFWISTLCLFSFVAGFYVYAWFDIRRKKVKAAVSPNAEEEPGSLAASAGLAEPHVPAGQSGAPESSLRDPVTGLYNRKHLIHRMQENIARCDRTKERMAVILWDIDGFMAFNNQFGQQEGDMLLKKVADTIRRCVRLYDESFRSGSDEFCALLIPADDEVSAEVTRRVSHTVSRDLFEPGTEYAERKFSISAGLVFYPEAGKIPEALLHAAGQSLYKMRQSKTEVPS